jgi:pilus assembly protein CpaB
VARVRRAAGNLIETVVATEHIPARTAISPGMVRVAKIPASDAKPDMATTLEQLTDRVTLVPVEKGEPFSLSTITDKSIVYGLAAIIPSGKRAMSITVDATDVVPGLLQPGQRVDVIATFVSGPDSVAKTILQNVPLMAVNGSTVATTVQQPEQPGQMVKPSPAATQPTATLITVAVTPSEAERLVAAQYKGKLRLGLRGMKDNARVETPGASTGMMLGTSPAAVTVSPSAQQPASPKNPQPTSALSANLPPMALPEFGAGPPAKSMKSVRVMKGTEVQDVPVDQ